LPVGVTIIKAKGTAKMIRQITSGEQRIRV
jgi:hypothetical protein